MSQEHLALLIGALGAVSSTTSVILFLPQAWAIWKLRNSPQSLLGVPTSRMILLWVQALLWITYGIALGQVWVSVPGIVNTPFMVTSIILVAHAHRTVKQEKSCLSSS